MSIDWHLMNLNYISFIFFPLTKLIEGQTFDRDTNTHLFIHFKLPILAHIQNSNISNILFIMPLSLQAKWNNVLTKPAILWIEMMTNSFACRAASFEFNWPENYANYENVQIDACVFWLLNLRGFVHIESLPMPMQMRRKKQTLNEFLIDGKHNNTTDKRFRIDWPSKSRSICGWLAG